MAAKARSLRATAKSVLILGGTREAALLAERLSANGKARLVTSFAGRTRRPVRPAGEIRTGGFGGPQGLAAYVREQGFDLIVDATHPFAENISVNAVLAASRSATPLKRLLRPPWRPLPGDNWQSVATVEDAASALPAGSRALLALGRQHIGAFAGRDDAHFVVRTVDRLAAPPPFKSATLIAGRPPSDWRAEAELLKVHALDRVVCRNSGGNGAYAKIVAARESGIAVIMVERPPPPEIPVFATVDALLAAIG